MPEYSVIIERYNFNDEETYHDNQEFKADHHMFPEDETRNSQFVKFYDENTRLLKALRDTDVVEININHDV